MIEVRPVERFLRYPGEQIYDLPCKGLKIIQHMNSYRFAIDAVLLANFVKAGINDSIIDLGTGSGVIAILLSAKTDAKRIVGIEIERRTCERAVRSVEMNGLQDRIQIVHGDINEASKIFGGESFSIVVTNPPYITLKEGKINPNPEIALARHEVKATLKDIVNAAWELLKFGGRFYMIYRTVRLSEAIYELKARYLEPKILQFVQPRANESPNLFMVMAKKGAPSNLKVLPPLVLYGSDGTYTDEVREMYFGKRQEV